ncbi:MAG: DUF5696 domain-containing protein [bacterium]|nr:DUF5696 domain-containing protein [bacterium]
MVNAPPFDARRLSAALTVLLLAVLLSAPSSRADAAFTTIPPGYEQIAENETFQLYVDASTLAFKLVDKRSGYLWHSGIDTLLEGDRLNTSWQAFARSGLSIEYLDARATNRRVSLGNSEHLLDVMPIEQGFSAAATFVEYGITVGITVQLDAQGVRVEVPFETIREENPDFRLSKVYVYPFLGAARGSTQPGYMLLPDGTGSIVRFADSTRAVNMFYGRYYGVDLGMISIVPYDDLVRQPMPISYPVFGMVHGEGENAYLSVVEEGAAYGEVQMHPAGILTNFNFLYTAFIYNETYFQPTNRSGAGVTTMQRQPNVFDAVVQYRFLTGDQANYVGMAHDYRAYLLDHQLLTPRSFERADIGIRLEFLGGDSETVLVWDRFIPMTTLSQMAEILDGLQIPNADVIYYGWQPSGATSVAPTALTLDGQLGSVNDLRALAENIRANGGDFALYYDPQAALWGKGGYSARTDLAMSITNETLLGFNRTVDHYFTMAVLEQRYRDLTAQIAAQADIGLALDGIGWSLYTDYRDTPPFSREAAIQAYRALVSESPMRLGLYSPNDYLFGQMHAYYDMPLSDNGYIYTSQPVPFLPTVLAGYVPYYGSALNFSSNRQDDLLRHIEYGIYPSFFLTAASTANMLNTWSAWIYTSAYDQWGEDVRQIYHWMNDLLAPVRGQPIVAHTSLARDVFATTYANGRQIIVNYTDAPYTSGSVRVEARNAVLVEVGE